MVVAISLGNFGALLLINSVALCLILVFSLKEWHLLALLLGYRVAHLPGHLPLNLVLDSVALLFGDTVALLPGNILTVFLRYILAVLLGHLVAHLLGLAVTLGGWYYRSYSLIDILALGNWHWTTDRLPNFSTFLLIFIISVGNLDSIALLSVNILAVLLLHVMALLHGNILALLGRNFVAYLSRLLPTFLTWLIPALFLSIFHNTFSLSNCCTLLLSNSSANFLMSILTLFLSNSVTFSFPDRCALLLSNSLTLLFILVLGNFLLHNLAHHVRCIMALFFLLQLTLVHCYVISFSFSSLLTNLFIFSFALFFMFSFTLFFRYFITLLIILSVTLFFMGGHFAWHLDSVALLPRLIPAFVLPDCGTGRYTT